MNKDGKKNFSNLIFQNINLLITFVSCSTRTRTEELYSATPNVHVLFDEGIGFVVAGE